MDCKNPCKQYVKALVAMETFEEDLDNFRSCWLDKQCTYLVPVLSYYQFQETKPSHEVVTLFLPGLGDPHGQLKLLCLGEFLLLQCGFHEERRLIGH